MPELTERARAFQAAIADFVGNKLKKQPKDRWEICRRKHEGM